MRENTKIVLYIVLLTLVVLDLINTSFIRYAQHKFDLGNTFHLRDDVRELYYLNKSMQLELESLKVYIKELKDSSQCSQ